jgi:hypothetical protein
MVSSHTRKKGPCGDASKKKNNVKDVVITRNGQSFARISLMSQPEPEAGHHQETVGR